MSPTPDPDASSSAASPRDNATNLLDGLRVLDLTRILAGPYCTMILADLGADVVKVERPGDGDEARSFGPFLPSGNRAPFAGLHRANCRIALDLKQSEDRDTFLALVRRADVLVENFRPGVMDGLDCGVEQLRAINPSLIFASASGFGQTGPDRDLPAYDVIIQAMSGLMSITGHDSDAPTRVGASVGDIVTGLFTTIGILAALQRRAQTGRGASLDLAMLDCAVAVLENAVTRCDVTGQNPEPLGTRHPSITPFQSFPTRDGAVVIAVGNASQWKQFCHVLGMPEWIDDARLSTNADRTKHQSQLECMISERTRTRTTDDWLDELRQAAIPAGPIRSISDVMQDQQLLSRGMFHRVDGDTGESFLTSGTPFHIDGTSPALSNRAPRLNQHATRVLNRWLLKSEAASAPDGDVRTDPRST
ncbi:MAG: CoA transferase [Planctomycetaceae bacterium]